MSDEVLPESAYPRGTGGCRLLPGTTVRVHGLKSQVALNGKEGIVEKYDPKGNRLHVRMPDGSLKGLSAKFLAKKVVHHKVQEASKVEVTKDAKAVNHVKEIFRMHDVNGDGHLSRKEMFQILSYLRLSSAMIDQLLDDMDKDRDGLVDLEELEEWWFRTGAKPNLTATAGSTGDAEDCDSDSDDSDGEEVTEDDIKGINKGVLPDGWPSHGLDVANNMRARFPEYPIEGILWKMKQNNYHGGNTLAAIRDTGTPEVAGMPPSAKKTTPGGFDAFPATYKVRNTDLPLKVYEEPSKTSANFLNQIRNRRIHPVGEILQKQTFNVKKVVYGNKGGIAFGRITNWGGERPGTKYWVDLGLEMTERNKWSGHYSNAERVNAL